MPEHPTIAIVLEEGQIQHLRNDLTHCMQEGAGSAIIIIGEPLVDGPERQTSDERDPYDMAKEIPAPDIVTTGTVFTLGVEDQAEKTFTSLIERKEDGK